MLRMFECCAPVAAAQTACFIFFSLANLGLHLAHPILCHCACPGAHMFTMYVWPGAGPVREFAVGRMNASRWPAVRLEEAPALALFPPDEIMLLSPDAEQPLLELDPSKVMRPGNSQRFFYNDVM